MSLLPEERIAQLVEDACQDTIDEGAQFNYLSVEHAIRTAVAEAQEAAARICEKLAAETAEQSEAGWCHRCGVAIRAGQP